ncbi:MAG: CarD family transcriptional regulator [Oscillospiraceae bacterium]
MFKLGQTILHGNQGVCTVEAIGPQNFTGRQEARIYYTLSPVHHEGTLFVPVDSAVFLREVITKEAAEDLIRQIPSVETEPFEQRNPRLIDEHYQTLLRSHDCIDLVRIIKTLLVKRRTVAKNGKRLGQMEERYLKRAKQMLYDELAVALDIPIDDVPDYVRNAIKQLEKET